MIYKYIGLWSLIRSNVLKRVAKKVNIRNGDNPSRAPAIWITKYIFQTFTLMVAVVEEPTFQGDIIIKDWGNTEVELHRLDEVYSKYQGHGCWCLQVEPLLFQERGPFPSRCAPEEQQKAEGMIKILVTTQKPFIVLKNY